MSSFYATNSPPKSAAMRGLNAQNSRTMKSLDKELSRLEAERKNKMKELNQATKHFLDLKLRAHSARSRETSPDRCSFVSLPAYARSMSRSPSPRPTTPLDDLFPLTSPRNKKIVYRKSLSTEESPNSSTQLSPNSSPDAQRKLLTKRNENNQNKLKKSISITETNITQVTFLSLPGGQTGSISNPTTPREKTTKTNGSNIGLPKIIVSDATPKLHDIPPKATPVPTSPAKKDPKESPRKHAANLNDSSNDDAVDGSLKVPVRRSRSNSVPNISSDIQQLLATTKHKPTAIADDSQIQLETPLELRPRSNSVCVPYFAHLSNAPRRDSLLRKYIARPKIFHRTAKTIDQLISDLAKGIYREELLDDKYRSKPITPEEWESLKKCRYLRMPSKNEDIKGNTIDIDAIFSD